MQIKVLYKVLYYKIGFFFVIVIKYSLFLRIFMALLQSVGC